MKGLVRAGCVCALLLLSLTVLTPAANAFETGGIGMTVAQLYDHSQDDPKGHLVVLDLFPGKPADQLGIHRGDIILRINDVDTAGKDLQTILNKYLRGKADTEVTLLIWRTSAKKKFKISMNREPISY